MDISPVQANGPETPAPTGSQKRVGKDEFLKLFVTKLQYQDPLSPMEDGDFIAQLAQFSSLEQLQNMNANLKSSINWDVLSNQTINNSVAAQIIGKEVVASLSELTLGDENTPKVSYELDEFASDVDIEILDINGDTVRSIRLEDVAGGRNNFVWDGKNDAGDRVSPGSYTVEMTATTANGTVMTPSLSIVGTVMGVVYRGGIAFLKIDGAEVALGEVREINTVDGN
jgi:flagellar basal-body rod modification protein FlgD